MKRRDFLVAAGAAMGGLATARSATAAPTHLTRAETQRLDMAVKGGFGPGFRIHAAERQGQGIIALIEHNENFLEVATTDLQSFTVLRATPM